MAEKSKDSFTYHKVSEAEKQEIKKQSKKLLDDFAAKLEELKIKDKKQTSSQEHFSSPNQDTKSGLRKQGEPWISDDDFIETTIENAPYAENNSIIAEKGGWK